MSRKESLEIQKKSDLLLFLEWNDPTARGVLTGKLFEYIVSGTPIISLGVTEEHASGKVIKNTKIGNLYNDKNKLKKDLMKIINLKKVFFYNPDIKEIEKYSREKQVKKLIKIMNNLEN